MAQKIEKIEEIIFLILILVISIIFVNTQLIQGKSTENNKITSLQSNLRDISIDGNISDWNGITPVLNYNNTPFDLGKELRQAYIANNNEYLFLRVVLAYPHFTSGNYISNVTIKNSAQTIYFVETIYSTVSYNPPSDTILGYASNFSNDVISSWISDSRNLSAGSIEAYNTTIDIVNIELEVPVSLLLNNSTVSNSTLEIKFWDVNYPLYNSNPNIGSFEAGLVGYLITNQNSVDTESNSNTINTIITTPNSIITQLISITTTPMNPIYVYFGLMALIFMKLFIRKEKI